MNNNNNRTNLKINSHNFINLNNNGYIIINNNTFCHSRPVEILVRSRNASDGAEAVLLTSDVLVPI
jgi:hypothetical protein